MHIYTLRAHRVFSLHPSPLAVMATHWWRVATNPSYLSDDRLHAIMAADRLVLSLAPSPPDAIPRTVTFCQIVGVMVRFSELSTNLDKRALMFLPASCLATPEESYHFFHPHSSMDQS